MLKYPTPEDMRTVSTRKLTTLLTKASHDRFREEKAKTLKSVALILLVLVLLKDAFAFQIRQPIEQLMFLEKQIHELEEQMIVLLRETRSDYCQRAW